MDYCRLEKYIIKKLRQELPEGLYYHRVEHSIHVVKDAEIIGIAEGLEGDDLLLLKTASLLHDSGFLEKPCLNESYACRIAEKILPDYAYTLEQIKLIEGMIMATAIPQKPGNLMEEVICDADLSYLGTSDAIIESKNLRQEMKSVKKQTFSEIEWIDFQLSFMELHNYFTPYAREYILPGKKQYIKFLLSEKYRLEDENGKVSK